MKYVSSLTSSLAADPNPDTWKLGGPPCEVWNGNDDACVPISDIPKFPGRNAAGKFAGKESLVTTDNGLNAIGMLVGIGRLMVL